MFGLGIGTTVMGGLGVAAAAIIGVLWLQNTSLESDIQVLSTVNAALEVSVAEQQKSIDTLIEDAELNERLSNELNTKLNEAENFKNVLLEKFSKHDLENLAAKKPKLIEKIINEATKDVFNDFNNAGRN